MKSTMGSLEKNRKGKYRNLPGTYEKDSAIFYGSLQYKYD